jgi:hypothetical protein
MGFATFYGSSLDTKSIVTRIVMHIGGAKSFAMDATMRAFYVFLLGLSALYAYWAIMMRTIKKQLPSTVLEVSYIDPEKLLVTRLYVFSMWRYLDLFAPREHVHLTWASSSSAVGFKTNPKGIYLIRTWNQANERQEGYVLSPAHLENALHIRSDLKAFGAFSDVGLATFLYSYVAKSKKEDIFEIMVNESAAFTTLQPYMASLILPNNVTARMAATLLKYLRTGTAHVDQVEEKDANEDKEAKNEKNEGTAQAKAAVIITDYHLEERTIKDDEYIVPTVLM